MWWPLVQNGAASKDLMLKLAEKRNQAAIQL
jgi:hypothetical protein